MSTVMIIPQTGIMHMCKVVVQLMGAIEMDGKLIDSADLIFCLNDLFCK